MVCCIAAGLEGVIPPFSGSGNLPHGVHWASWAELVERFGINVKRRQLLRGLQAALLALQKAGCETVYINNGGLSPQKSTPTILTAAGTWTG
jgi:hypothetical protein